MKIGVLTLPLHTNYGGNLQAYALITTLKKMGHDAWLIKWEKDRIPYWKAPLTIAKRLVLRYILGKGGVDIGTGIFDRRKRSAIEMYAKQFICRRIVPQTTGFRSTRALARFIGRYRFDVIVVGSDQVWRPAPNVEDYFLGFLDDAGLTTRRVAYAASFGTDRWTFNSRQHKACEQLLKKFDEVSVREDAGVALCRQYFGVQAKHVLDPTMLLPCRHYVELAWDGCPLEQRSGGKGVFVYVLDSSLDKENVADCIASSLGLERFTIENPTKDRPTPVTAAPPVEYWLRCFDEADFIVTDSFHGCVFSIIFNKPFIAYANASRGLSRFESLLKMFHLDDRLIHSSADLTASLLRCTIDWTAVNAILASLQADAASFLTTAVTCQNRH